MRNIVNISLPDQMARQIQVEVKKGHFASKSEFFRHLIRLWNDKQLGAELRIERKKFELEGGEELKSLRDLR